MDLTVVKIRARRKTEAKIIPPTREAKKYFLEEQFLSTGLLGIIVPK